ncbi:MAG: Stk1 family PASTA domain-containing Ser/Thr kinase, partial [Limnochordales bacterium]
MIDTLLANRYRIQAKIGDGGMAVVYRALDIVLHRPVAIKCLRPQFASDPEFRQRFIQEAQAAASLSHPNVVNIFDVGRAGDVHYIVLEYVQGRNLKEILREEGRLSPRRAAHIARAVARALEAAHRRQLIHRDIKPHNILITPEGRVKVTDFGIARAASTATLTQTGTVIGSVHYFSPEQARGEAVGPASDLYSLGVVLYEMLTGTVPFVGESPIAVAIKHVQEEPVPPRRHVPTIPVWLERVVLKALAKDPAQRYASAEEMAQDLAWRTDQVAARPLAPADEEDWSAGDGAGPRGLEDRVEQRTRR